MKANLSRHFQAVHEKTTFRCEICRKSFSPQIGWEQSWTAANRRQIPNVLSDSSLVISSLLLNSSLVIEGETRPLCDRSLFTNTLSYGSVRQLSDSSQVAR